MGSSIPKQRLYATLLALGACILLYRTIAMIAQGKLSVLILWASVLLIAELLIDLSCLVSSIHWWITNDKKNDLIPLRFGAAAVILHAVRVLVYVFGRVGPWTDFDIRPEHRTLHPEQWSWGGLYFAAIMSVLGVCGVIVIWRIKIRSRKNQ
jgi:hypothetical protein